MIGASLGWIAGKGGWNNEMGVKMTAETQGSAVYDGNQRRSMAGNGLVRVGSSCCCVDFGRLLSFDNLVVDCEYYGVGCFAYYVGNHCTVGLGSFQRYLEIEIRSSAQT